MGSAKTLPILSIFLCKGDFIRNQILSDGRLDPDLQSIQLSDLIDIRDGDIVHLEPPVNTGVIEVQLFGQLLSLNAVLAHGDSQERQPLETVLSDQAFNIHDDAQALYPKAKEIQDTTLLLGCTLGKEYFATARKLDPYKWLRRFDKPVLILGAGNDDKVPAEYLEKALESFPSSATTEALHALTLFCAERDV